MPETTNPQPDDLAARLEAALTARFTELGNPFSAMRRQEKGPDGWPASHPVGPHHVAEVLRELLAAAPAPASAPADRGAVLREAIEELAARTLLADDCSCAEVLRRMADEQPAPAPSRVADEAQQDETQAEPSPVCQGFQWIGQSFATCDRCGQPAWEHAGEDVAVEGAGPFDNRRTVRPWKPGQADAIRAKWAPRAASEEPAS
ncbi:hypothetical protein [Streptomyces sp. AK02-04a]|uniref:hypothetical protein n=1 Tax=Streptomyces sp. AK02-04a TaxID=3028649 RepID=UPI0029A69FB9|nr:hypothetical protein [Streptomyces sp. AK02-04a]MDX3759305.1 hypothetical protein [Streptomyces sp. AK02-04a]